MSKAFDKKDYKNELIQTKEVKDKHPLDLKKIMISFKEINSNQRKKFIYLGDEKMPFSARHSIYQKLFRDEFVRAIETLHKRIISDFGSTKFSTSF